MPNLNKVMLMGNLTRDPELKTTNGGTAVCQFGLAINREFTANGEKREEVLFLDIEAWGKQAETIAKYCTKGRPLFVEGRLKQEQWEDKTSGQKRSKIKIVLESFQFLGGGKSESSQGSESADTQMQAIPESRKPFQPEPVGGAVDDDIPF